jgi:hypothetical protein
MKGVKKMKPSAKLEEETKNMEEKLENLKSMMTQERERKQGMKLQGNDGGMWRSATKN